MKRKIQLKLWIMSEFFIYGILLQSVFCNFILARNGMAQKSIEEVKVSVEFKQTKLTKAFELLEGLTAFHFAFDNGSVSKSTRLTASFKDASLADVLRYISGKSGIHFKRINGTIHLSERQESQSEIEEVKFASNISRREITTGKVTSSQGEELPGVNIVIKGTSNGTITDITGNFSIDADADAVLVFTYIGYQTQEVQINGRSVIDVRMELDLTQLEEVVVVGYGTQNQKDLTGSVVSVKTEDFTKGANYDAVQLLNGAAAGVNVSQVSSAPGAGLRIQIRGAGSINSDNSVLFVVDGLPGVDPSSLSPGDIESIDVLKDASAAAIYGTRAANGVVLITTKKGKAGETSISYSAYTGFQSIAKDLDVLGGSDYAELVNLRQMATGGTEVYSSAEIASFGNGTNWQDEIFTDAIVHNHQISMSGGTDKGNYYLGLNYFDQNGIVKNTDSEKFNIRLNVQSNPIKNLILTANANFTRQTNDEVLFSNRANENAGPINSAIQYDPTLSGLDANGRYNRNAAIGLDHPVALNEGITNGTGFNRFYASVSADYSILENLTATIRFGGDVNNSKADFFRSRITEGGLASGGFGSLSSTEDTHWLVESLLKYSTAFNEDHNFSILGGTTFEEFETTNVFASSAAFLSDVTLTNLLQSGNGDLNDNVASGRIQNQLNGFIGRTTYDYQSKYLLTASFRVDGSSRFAENNKYAFFPSASVGWRMSEEDFLSGVDAIDELKVRIGYGELGNQGINNFETRGTLISGGNSVFGGSVAQGVLSARLQNPQLKWETTKEVNFGIDYALINNRITGTIDIFNRNTSDQLFNKPLPSVVGFSSVRTNLGEVRNTGVDISVRAINVEKNSFKWTSSLNLSFLKNEVTELPEFTQEIIGGSIGTFISQYTIVREGAALRSFYGYEIDGIFQTGDDIANSPAPDVTGYSAGHPRFVDQNSDGIIDSDDRVVLGDPFPDFTFGFKNTLSYQNLSLDIFFTGVQGIETLDANVTESLLGGVTRDVNMLVV